MKRVVVTGALGFCASHLIKYLLKQDCEVVATDRSSTLANEQRQKVCALIGLDLDHPNLKIVPADLLDPPSLQPLFTHGVSHVFHVASLYDYSARAETLNRVNITGTKNLLEQVKNHSIDHFLHWSTCGVFGKPFSGVRNHSNNTPFTEKSSSPRNTPKEAHQPNGTKLVNAYSVSKWKQEKLVWSAHQEDGLPVTILRPAPVYGPGSDYGHSGIVIGIAKGYVPFIPASAKHVITTSVHVEDIARFALYAATNKATIGEDFNLADNSIISDSEFLHYIALLTGRPMWDIPLIPLSLVRFTATQSARIFAWLSRNMGMPRWRVLEVQSAPYIGSSYWISNRKSMETGFEYHYPDVREGLKDTVAWLREAQWI